MPREIDCLDCGGMGYWDIKGNQTRKCPDCKDGKIIVYTESEVQELIKAERELKTELKNAYAETVEQYIPDEYLGQANDYLLSLFKDHEVSKVMCDRKEAIRAKHNIKEEGEDIIK